MACQRGVPLRCRRVAAPAGAQLGAGRVGGARRHIAAGAVFAARGSAAGAAARRSRCDAAHGHSPRRHAPQLGRRDLARRRLRLTCRCCEPPVGGVPGPGARRVNVQRAVRGAGGRLQRAARRRRAPLRGLPAPAAVWRRCRACHERPAARRRRFRVGRAARGAAAWHRQRCRRRRRRAPALVRCRCRAGMLHLALTAPRMRAARWSSRGSCATTRRWTT